jgi:hypothetical protein
VNKGSNEEANAERNNSGFDQRMIQGSDIGFTVARAGMSHKFIIALMDT